jgi:nucleotide-binding universal stress UspA family protein
METRSRIVVGVDGSDGSRAALEFAMDEAARRGSGVRVVWAIPETGYWAAAYGMTPALAGELGRDLEKAGREMVEAVVADRGEALAGVPVDVLAVSGPAAAVLVGQAAEADLLVVGHRGLGGLGSAVLGSVGLQCVLHAPTPVTVVPHPHTGAHAHAGG